MKGKRIISLICAVTLLSSLLCVPAKANSTAPFWEGTNANSVIVKEGDIPIVVENELLTFDLPTLPYAKYKDTQSFLAYDSKVTAEYTFCNPTDMTITTTLYFPFETYTSYGSLSGDTHKEKYGVYINGEKIEANIRHTDIFDYSNFDANAHIATLSDEFVQDDFYSPDLTVTKYSYEIVGQSIPSAYFRLDIDYVGSERRIVLYNGHLGGYITNSGGFSMSTRYNKSEKKTVCFYVFGKPLDTMPDASWYKRNGTNPETKIDGEYRYLGSESTTLNDFIFSEYDENRGISKVDWYNACISRLNHKEESRGTTRAISVLYLGASMRWYEYKVVFKPGEKIKNTVVAPMYPDINALNKIYEYNYTYLLSPASCWADFGKLDIVINTPYKMSEVSIEGFEKTETGYKLSREGLPREGDMYEDLRFTLLNDGNTPLHQPGASIENTSKGIFDVIVSFFKNIFQSIVQFIRSIIN